MCIRDRLLSGLPAGAGYMASTTKPGYSSDYTVEPTPENPNPFNRPLTIAESMVTTKYLMIDRVSDLSIRTLTPREDTDFTDSFNDGNSVATFNNTVVDPSGDIRLDVINGSPTSGDFFTIPIGGNVHRWYNLEYEAQNWGTATFTVHIYYDDNGVLRLIPDTDLPGNSAGFTDLYGTIDLSNLDADVYDAIIFNTEFQGDGSETSRIKYVTVSYTHLTLPTKRIV